MRNEKAFETKSEGRKKRIEIKVSGRVHGVFFRDSIQRRARSLGLFGFVKNLETGEVLIVAEGEEVKLKKLKDWASEGPFLAKVGKIEVTFKKATGEFENFEIRY